jgi:cytochrome P450
LGVHPNYLHRLIRNLELKDVLKETLRDISPRGAELRAVTREGCSN